MCCQHRHILLVYVFVNQSWDDRLREPDSAVNHNPNQGGRHLMVWAGVGTELKMDKRKKRPDGPEKLRLKKLKSLEVEAAKCSKLTDLFGAWVTTPAGAAASGDERVEA